MLRYTLRYGAKCYGEKEPYVIAGRLASSAQLILGQAPLTFKPAAHRPDTRYPPPPRRTLPLSRHWRRRRERSARKELVFCTLGPGIGSNGIALRRVCLR